MLGNKMCQIGNYPIKFSQQLSAIKVFHSQNNPQLNKNKECIWITHSAWLNNIFLAKVV